MHHPLVTAALVAASLHVAVPSVLQHEQARPSVALVGEEELCRWLQLRIDAPSPSIELWFVDKDGKWGDSMPDSPRGIAVVRRAADRGSISGALRFGPVLVSPANLDGTTDLDCARQARLLMLGFQSASHDTSSAPKNGAPKEQVLEASESSGCDIALRPAEPALGLPPAIGRDLIRAHVASAPTAGFSSVQQLFATASKSDALDSGRDEFRRRELSDAARLFDHGLRLLAEARELSLRASGADAVLSKPSEPASTAERRPAWDGQDRPSLIPPASPIGFVAWIVAVDGEQALHRMRGEIAAADREIARIRKALHAIGLLPLERGIEEVVPLASTGFRSWTFSAERGFDEWDIASAVSRAIADRTATLKRLAAMSLAAALREGVAPEGLKELEKRLGMLEPFLPLGWKISAADERLIEEHLGQRFDASLRQGLDEVQARTVAWELYAGAWNLSGALPGEVLDARRLQRSRMKSLALEGLSAIAAQSSAAGADLAAALDSVLQSPFQAAMLCPVSDGIEREMMGYLAERSRREFTAADQAILRAVSDARATGAEGEGAWRRYIAARNASVLADILGPAASDTAAGELRVVPLVPFADCRSYFASSDGKPPFPRLVVR